MPKLFMLPTREDQALLSGGRVPENHFAKEFATSAEASAYEDGLGAVNDLVEYEILEETDISLTVEIDGEEDTFSFSSAGEKNAYKEGLEDGEGFVSPAVYSEGTDEYVVLDRLLALASPVP